MGLDGRGLGAKERRDASPTTGSRDPRKSHINFTRPSGSLMAYSFSSPSCAGLDGGSCFVMVVVVMVVND